MVWRKTFHRVIDDAECGKLFSEREQKNEVNDFAQFEKTFFCPEMILAQLFVFSTGKKHCLSWSNTSQKILSDGAQTGRILLFCVKISAPGNRLKVCQRSMIGFKKNLQSIFGAGISTQFNLNLIR